MFDVMSASDQLADKPQTESKEVFYEDNVHTTVLLAFGDIIERRAIEQEM